MIVEMALRIESDCDESTREELLQRYCARRHECLVLPAGDKFPELHRLQAGTYRLDSVQGYGGHMPYYVELILVPLHPARV
jgi:hypothetical protein